MPTVLVLSVGWEIVDIADMVSNTEKLLPQHLKISYIYMYLYLTPTLFCPAYTNTRGKAEPQHVVDGGDPLVQLCNYYSFAQRTLTSP